MYNHALTCWEWPVHFGPRLREDDVFARPTGAIVGGNKERPQLELHTQWKWHVLWELWTSESLLGKIVHMHTPFTHRESFRNLFEPKEKACLDWVTCKSLTISVNLVFSKQERVRQPLRNFLSLRDVVRHQYNIYVLRCTYLLLPSSSKSKFIFMHSM